MNIDVMRFVDRFVGIPLCWMMGLYCHVVAKLGSRTKRRQVRNILVIKFFGMGSLLLSSPALTLARRAFPEARVTFLTFQKNRELVERVSTIDSVLTIDHSSVLAFLRDTFSTIRSIIRIRADITFDLEFFSKFSTLLSGFSQAPVRVAFALPTYWRSSIVTHQVPLEKNRHVVHSFCEQIFCISDERANIPPIEAPYVGEQDHASLLHKLPVEGRRLVAINVNAGDTFLERRWPADRFARLVSALAREEDCIFCFTGSGGESDYVRGVIHQTDCPEKCIDTSGVLTVPELAALFQRCEILISNDSGPLHLAASLGIPTVGLYGPESPDFYGVVQADSRVIYKKISCSPCMNIYSAKQFRCPYNAQCMRELSVDQVVQSVRSSILVEE